MQITFTPALSGKQGDVFTNDRTAVETTAQRYIRKERERKGGAEGTGKGKTSGVNFSRKSLQNGENEKVVEKRDQKKAMLGTTHFSMTQARRYRNRANSGETGRNKLRSEKSISEEDDSNKAELELVMMDDGDATKGRPALRHQGHRARGKGHQEEGQGTEKSRRTEKKACRSQRSRTISTSTSRIRDSSRSLKIYFLRHRPVEPHKFRDTKGMRAILSEKEEARARSDVCKTEGGSWQGSGSEPGSRTRGFDGPGGEGEESQAVIKRLLRTYHESTANPVLLAATISSTSVTNSPANRGSARRTCPRPREAHPLSS